MTQAYHAGYVLDASVAVKWFAADEPDAGKAEALLLRFTKGGARLLVPRELFMTEVANALRFNRKVEEADLAAAVSTLWRLRLDGQEFTEELLQKAVAIAHGYAVSVYDALYVAIAELRGHPLITADDQLLKRLHGHSIALPLRSLEI